MNIKGEAYCVGCGAKLQYEHEEKEGYILKSRFNKGGDLLCKRCYDIRFHNRVGEVNKVNIDYQNLIENIILSNNLVVYVADIFSFNPDSINKMLNKFKNKIIFVINKVDILPKSLNENKIISWVKDKINNKNIIKYIVSSSKTNYHMDELITLIDTHRNGKDVYFVGSTNAGKSSIINAFLKNYINLTNKCITTSCYANTTLQIVEIPLDKKSYLFDTPGFIEENNMTNYIEASLVNKILPNKEIKPQVYQVSNEQAFYIGGLMRLDIEPTRKSSIIIYGSQRLKIQRIKGEKKDLVFENLINNKQIEPVSKNYLDLRKFDEVELYIDRDKVDLYYPGYAFVTLRNLAGTIVKVKIVHGSDVYLIDSLI